MLFELVRGYRRELLQQLGRRDLGRPVLAARGKEEREQRLEHSEALGRDRAGLTLGNPVDVAHGLLPRGLWRRSLMPLAHAPQRRSDLLLQLVRLEGHCAAVLA